MQPNTTILIKDINGRKIFETNVLGDVLEIQLNEIAQKGIYFVEAIQNGFSISSNKVILE